MLLWEQCSRSGVSMLQQLWSAWQWGRAACVPCAHCHRSDHSFGSPLRPCRSCESGLALVVTGVPSSMHPNILQHPSEGFSPTLAQDLTLREARAQLDLMMSEARLRPRRVRARVPPNRASKQLGFSDTAGASTTPQRHGYSRFATSLHHAMASADAPSITPDAEALLPKVEEAVRTIVCNKEYWQKTLAVAVNSAAALVVSLSEADKQALDAYHAPLSFSAEGQPAQKAPNLRLTRKGAAVDDIPASSEGSVRAAVCRQTSVRSSAAPLRALLPPV